SRIIPTTCSSLNLLLFISSCLSSRQNYIFKASRFWGSGHLRCDGPACRRLLEMIIRAAADGSVEFETKSLHVEDRAPVALLSRGAARSTELIRVCAWCNRIDSGSGSGEWVEIEDAVERLGLFELQEVPQLTHGICEACFDSMTCMLAEMETSSESSL
ncbi:MAG: hypothetical protein ACFCUX_00665, partial [Candidatus Methylacidiphilales bacterium]